MNVASRNAEAGVTLSVRETRMIVERILLTTGLPDGFVPAVGNCILYSQALRLGGLAAFAMSIDTIAAARLADIALVEEQGACILDAGRNHAWLVANDVPTSPSPSIGAAAAARSPCATWARPASCA